MSEYGSMNELLNVVCGIGLIAFGAREAYREKINSGARLMGLMVIGMGLLLIK